jgi:NADH:ubiquinone oxidoreductase subunit B-like Fe-S oxidoreductase
MEIDGRQLSGLARWGLKKSPWAFHLNAGSCNNCDIEILDALTPKYDVDVSASRSSGRHGTPTFCW